jgi:hypothetical protein
MINTLRKFQIWQFSIPSNRGAASVDGKLCAVNETGAIRR